MTSEHFLIVPASGIGSRMNVGFPKQYLRLDNGKTILDQTLETLLNIEKIKGCVVVIAEHDNEFTKSPYSQHRKILAVATGGKLRFNSVLNALNTLKAFARKDDWVLVHDAVRPCILSADVLRLIAQLEGHPSGGLLATKVVDTIKQTHRNMVINTLDRGNLWQAQTPQMYRFGVLSKALEKAKKDKLNITDESVAVEHLGMKSVIVAGSPSNLKLTTPEDLVLANFYLK